MIKLKKYLLILISIILQSATPSLADCEVNTEISHTLFSSGRLEPSSAGYSYKFYENGLDKDDIEFMKTYTESNQLFEAKFKGKNIKDLFYQSAIYHPDHKLSSRFAISIKYDLIDQIKNKLCGSKTNELPYNLRLEFISLQMVASKSVMTRLKQRFTSLKGSYANLKIDTNSRLIEATIIWNPRRMLKDLLILHGWSPNEQPITLPFEKELVDKMVTYYSDEFDSHQLGIDEVDFNEIKLFLKGSYWNIITAHTGEHILFWGLEEALLDTYTEVTKQAIKSLMNNPYSPPVKTIKNVQIDLDRARETITLVRSVDEILKNLGEN